MRLLFFALASLALTACASVAPRTGSLSSYEGLSENPNAVRAKIATRADPTALASITRVRIAPARFADTPATWLTPEEQQTLLREIDAQFCFEMSKRYAIATMDDESVHAVRAIVAEVQPTGQAGSAASAAASFFVPGPIGFRAPTGRGALAAEAEMLDPQGRQVAALVWSRRATVVGTDNPSLSRIGDALQFAAPFADAAAAAMTPKTKRTKRQIEKPDPCELYGPRFRPEGWLTRFATGLYVPRMSGASREKVEQQ